MRLRHIKGAEEQIAESPYVIQDPQGLKGKWHEFFGNQNPIVSRWVWERENSSWNWRKRIRM